MSDLKNHYQAILTELENHFQNEDDQAFVLSKFQELSMMFMDVIDRLTYLTDIRIKEVEEKQQEIDNRIETVKKAVDGIENDIYEDDEAYEFEIVCPYCNHEFVADIEDELKEEIRCPECHNIIELDWDEDDEEEGCSGCCSSCHGHDECEEDDEDIDEKDDDKKDEDDDM